MDASRPDSTTAERVSFAVLVLFGLALLGMYAMAILGIEIKPTTQNILSGMIGALIVSLAGVVGYWTGSSAGSRTANAALAQLAGAGPPPPASPGAGDPPGPAVE